MKIAILGAGAMGSLFGAYLSEKNQVTLISRNKSYINEVNNNGLTIKGLDGDSRVFYPEVLTSSQAGARFSKNSPDLTLVLVRAIQTREAMEENQGLFGVNTIAVSLQNGYGNHQVMQDFISPNNIVVGTTCNGAMVKGPGSIVHAGRGVTTVGSFSKDERGVTMAKAILSDSGFETLVSENIKEDICRKLIINVGINPICALLDKPNRIIVEDSHAARASEALVREAVDVLNCCGMEFNADDSVERVREVASATASNTCSMLADIHRHRQTEIEMINGAIVNMAKEIGMEAPLNRQIKELIEVNGY